MKRHAQKTYAVAGNAGSRILSYRKISEIGIAADTETVYNGNTVRRGME